LLDWLLRQPPALIDPRQILRIGPRQLRDIKRRDAAIELTVAHHYLIPQGIGKTHRYLLNPAAKGTT
jgi:hypothetical protein